MSFRRPVLIACALGALALSVTAAGGSSSPHPADRPNVKQTALPLVIAPPTTSALEVPTTTEAPPPVTTTTIAPPTVTSTPMVLAPMSQSLDPCGGDLPPCSVKQRESHGDYTARNPGPEAACGAWQIITSTWAGFAGYPTACDAPPAVQDEKARQLWQNGAGCNHWSAC